MIDRLRDERFNIFYTAAYLDLLRDVAPSGSDWPTIYGTEFSSEVGEHNGYPHFISGFTQAMNAYQYLDDER
jgi:hypothetical protein